MTHNDIDPLARAIYEKCGMRVTLSKTWSEFDLEVSLQVRLKDDANGDNQDDWQFFKAWSREDLPRLRDELLEFITSNRKECAA